MKNADPTSEVTHSTETHQTPGRRRSFATVELSEEEVAAIVASRMDDRHAYLDAMLDQ